MELNSCIQTVLAQEGVCLYAQRKDAISIFNDDLDYNNQEDIANLISSQRQELLFLKVQLQKKDEEKDILASSLREANSELSALKQKYAEALYLREGQSHLQKSSEDRLDTKPNELIALKDETENEVSIKKIMSEKIQELENDFQLKVTQNESLHQSQQCLQDEKLQLEATVRQLAEQCESLQQTGNHMAKALQEKEIQLTECQSRFSRQLNEDHNAVSLLQHEFEKANAEREVLEAQLAALHRVVMDSLQLVSTLNSGESLLLCVSKHQIQQSNVEVECQSNCLTPENFLTLSSKVDSGIASQQPSTLPSHFSMRGDSQSPPLVSESNQQLSVEFHGQLMSDQNVEEDECMRAGNDLTISILGDTSCGSHYDVNPLPHLEPDIPFLEEPSVLNNLSVFRLDHTLEQSAVSKNSSEIIIPPDIQNDLSKLHCSIHDLIESYVLASNKASEFQEKLLKIEEQFAQDKHAAAVQISELSCKVQQKDADLNAKQEQLTAAEAKIRELVNQVENGGNDLVEGVEDLLEAFKTNEKILADLKQQLREASELLLKKDEQLLKLGGELSTLKMDAKNQLQAFEMEKQEWQSSCLNSEQELKCLQSNSMSVEQECAALREFNAQLRMEQEKLQLALHSKDTQITQLINDYTQQLQNKCDEISYFKDLPNQLASKERIIESLVSEKEPLLNRLYAVEHELAMSKSSEGCWSEKLVSVSTALEEKTKVAQELQEQLYSLQNKLTETEHACRHACSAESQIREEIFSMQCDYKRALQDLQKKSLLLTRHFGTLRTEYVTKLDAFTALLQSKQFEFMKLLSSWSDKQRPELSLEYQALRDKNLDLLQLLTEKDAELELIEVSRANLENNLSVAVDEKHDTEKKFQLLLSQLEEQLASVRNDLAQQRAHSELLQNRHNKLRAKIGALDARHKEQVETLKVLHEQALVLQNKTHVEELTNVRKQFHAVIQNMTTEHEQHISQLNMEHAEDLERQRNEMASHHAGEIAFLKMQSHETSPHLAEHNDKPALDVSDPPNDAVEDFSDEILISKIMELGPLLEAEAEAVRELCCLTGQELPLEDGNETSSDPLQSIIEQLQVMLHELRNKMTASEIEDWRKELIAIVEKILQQEHNKLAGMAVQGMAENPNEQNGDEDFITKYQRVFQEQMSNYSSQIQQLHSAECDSLIAQMKELQHTFDTMRTEQKEQISILQSQLVQVKESSKLENQNLLNQLNEVNSAHMHQLEEVLQLRAALESEGVKLAQLHLHIKQVEADNQKLQNERETLESSVQTLQEELLDARKNFSELEELAGRAATTITLLDQELRTSRSKEADLKKIVAEFQTYHGKSSYEMHDTSGSVHQPEEVAGELPCSTEELQERLAAMQRELSSSRQDVIKSQQVLSIKQQEIERLQENIKTQEADHKMKMERFSQLFEREHKANGTLRDALHTREAELQALKREYAQPQHSHGQSFPAVQTSNKKMMNPERAYTYGVERAGVEADSSGSIVAQEVVEIKFGQLYMQYRQAELRRKSLIFQKKYLQCQLDAFYQTQQASLMMLADMGALVDTELAKTNASSTPRSRSCFKVAAIAVKSIVRIRLFQRKKVKYIRHKLDELMLKLASPNAISPVVSTYHSDHDPRPNEQSPASHPTSARRQHQKQRSNS